MKLLLSVLCCVLSLSAQTALKGSGALKGSVRITAAAVGGGGGTIAPVGHILGAGGGGTTGGITSTGAASCYVWRAGLLGGSAPTDSKGNTYVLSTAQDEGPSLEIWYANADTGSFAVGTGHTFTVATDSFYAFGGACFSNIVTSASIDSSNGAFTSGTTISPSITVGSGQHLVLVALNSGIQSGTWTGVSGGFTILDQIDFAGGVNYGGALAYFVQPSAATVNPTATFDTSAALLQSVIASFKGI